MPRFSACYLHTTLCEPLALSLHGAMEVELSAFRFREVAAGVGWPENGGGAAVDVVDVQPDPNRPGQCVGVALAGGRFCYWDAAADTCRFFELFVGATPICFSGSSVEAERDAATADAAAVSTQTWLCFEFLPGKPDHLTFVLNRSNRVMHTMLPGAHQDEARVFSFAEHAAPVACIAVDAAGGFVASGSRDGALCLWNADVAHFNLHAAPVGKHSMHVIIAHRGAFTWRDGRARAGG